jgi:HKD family nuclease
MAYLTTVKKTSFEIIENRGPNTVAGFLRTSLVNARSANLAVSFISETGLSMILPKLRRIASRGGVRVVTGLYQDITEPAALRTLLRAQRESHGRFAARLSRNMKFHRKLFLMKQSWGD